jgi:hypothetical protein
MRSALAVTGVLGLGTGLVFAAAAVAATAFPNGGTVVGSSFGWAPDRLMDRRGPVQFGGPMMIDDGVAIDVVVFDDGVAVDGDISIPEQGPPLPGPGSIAQP